MIGVMESGARPRRPRAAGSLAIGYVGLAGFLVLEATTRRRGDASRLDATGDDADTTRRLGRAYAIGAAAPLLAVIPAPRLGRGAAVVGLATQAAGLGLRSWSMRALGRAYTRTLRAVEDQRVVEEGPYRFVRHPGYLGSLLIWLGFGLTSRNPLVVAAIAGVSGDAYRRRIAAEDRLLRRELPGYGRYAERTSRLVPFIW